MPLLRGISAAAIDGGLHALTAAGVTVLGIIATLLFDCHFAVCPSFWWVASLCIPGRCRAHSTGDPGGCVRRKPLAVDGKRGQSDWAIALASQLGQRQTVDH